jgi:hypothetical protein
MELETVNTEPECSLCDIQEVFCSIRTVDDEDDGRKPIQGKERQAMFHETCDHCDDTDSKWDIQLCDSCRHLRFRHLLICYPRRFPNLSTENVLVSEFQLDVSIQPLSDASDQCALCRFWRACMKNDLQQRNWEKIEEQPQYSLWTLHITACGSFNVTSKTGRSSAYTKMGADFPGGMRRKVCAYVDWDWLRQWLHDLAKPAINRYTTISLHHKLDDQELQLRGIDVLSDCVVSIPPESEYLALSYVWGAESVDQLRCLKSNVDLLAKPGQLSKFSLPRTISDAILVCQKLGYRFLWVDRLCIVQDESMEALSTQLNQMASIYNRATLTLVAATGNDAGHGLAGVSYARDAKQIALKCNEDFELVSITPHLMDLLRDSKWKTRGWTYQEDVASKKLLFFTDYGLRFRNGIDTAEVRQEDSEAISWLLIEEVDLRIVGEFTKRELTHESDILHASAGILHALDGDCISFGMPWDKFDVAMLWVPRNFDRKPRISTPVDIFPTWSWASSTSAIQFRLHCEPIFSLAYWGRVTVNASTATDSLSWSTMPPKYDSVAYKNLPWPRHTLKACYTVAGLARLHGCVRSEAPKSFLVDCTGKEYAERLEKRWGTPPSAYWDDTFLGYNDFAPFAHIDKSILSHSGRLLVHTQKASFSLDRRGRGLNWYDTIEPGLHPIIVRTENHGVAGSLELDDYSFQRLQRSGQGNAEFIALSICDNMDTESSCHMMVPFIARYFSHLSVAAFYGCPCSTRLGESVDWDHIVECPEHKDFRSIEIQDINYHGSIFSYDLTDLTRDHAQAYAHHLARLSYYDINGDLMHRALYPPPLWVMLIAPSENGGEQNIVYQRLGIGRIYLKSWVEASPTFETLVLE